MSRLRPLLCGGRNDKTVLELITDPWAFTNGPEDDSREYLRELLIEPVTARLLHYFGAACVQDCVRVDADFEERQEGDTRDRWLSDSARYAPPTHLRRISS
jgi:hypothetical protein